MKKLMLATAALGALTVAGPVLAADLPARMPYKAPPPPPVPYFSWSGCYIGGHVGGAWGHKNFSDTFFGTFIGGSVGFDYSGWLAGGQAGCQWEITNIVFGVEGDGSWTNLSASATDPFDIDASVHAKTDVIYDITARLGWAWDRWLIYAKGGGAWAHETFNVVDVDSGIAASASNDRNGWVIGGGVEWAFWENWSAKIEYLHYDFGSRTTPFSVLGIPTFDLDIHQRVDTVKFGINWRFYPFTSPAPVVARY